MQTRLSHLDERKFFWKWIHARIAFDRIVTAIHYVQETEMERSHPAYEMIVAGIFVSYARPFNKSYGAMALKAGVVPAKYRELHDGMLKYRDSVFAHVDADARFQGGEQQVNAISLKLPVIGGGRPVFHYQITTPSPSFFQQVEPLVQALIEKANYYAVRFQDKHHREMPMPSRVATEYRLNCEDPNAPAWIKPPSA